MYEAIFRKTEANLLGLHETSGKPVLDTCKKTCVLCYVTYVWCAPLQHFRLNYLKINHLYAIYWPTDCHFVKTALSTSSATLGLNVDATTHSTAISQCISSKVCSISCHWRIFPVDEIVAQLYLKIRLHHHLEKTHAQPSHDGHKQS